MTEDPHEEAERIARKTQRILWFSGLALIVWQFAYFTLYQGAPMVGRNVDMFRALAFLAWSGALLLLVASGGGAFASRAVRRILSDELARQGRAEAYRYGFWAMMLIAFAGYVSAHFTAISSLDLAHAIVSGGLLVGVLTLAYLGRR